MDPVVSTVSTAPKPLIVQEKKVVMLPNFVTFLYNFLQVILVLSAVSSLWVIAVGLWQIKYYVECQHGARSC